MAYIEYRYRITSTGKSSAQLGPCEICGKYASEVFYQVEERKYLYNGKTGWTQKNCRDYFGHKECLIEKRRLSDNAIPEHA